MTPRARWLVLTLALVGLAFASASSWVHYRLLTDPTYISPCDINATLQLHAGLPEPVRLGVGRAGGARRRDLVRARRAHRGLRQTGGEGAIECAGRYIFALSTIGLAAILYLGYASFFVLKTGCLLCMGTYVCVIGIFVTAGLPTTTAMGAAAGAAVQRSARGDGASAVPDGGLPLPRGRRLGGRVLPARRADARGRRRRRRRRRTSSEQFTNAWWQQPRVDLGIPADGAKVVVVKFNDWLCPACKADAPVRTSRCFDKFEKESPGRGEVRRQGLAVEHGVQLQRAADDSRARGIVRRRPPPCAWRATAARATR